MILSGQLKDGRGARLASERLKQHENLLKSKDIKFPPLHMGTLNIKLSEEFETPKNSKSVIFISMYELRDGWGEDWYFIPVLKINGENKKGYILRTTRTCHKDDVAELIAEYIEVVSGQDMELTISNNTNHESNFKVNRGKIRLKNIPIAEPNT